MSPLPGTTLLLAVVLSHYHQFTYAWPRLPTLRDRSAECVNGAKLPAHWSIADLSVDFSGGEPNQASFTLGSSHTMPTKKGNSLVTCRYNKVESGFGCTGQGEGMRVTLEARPQVGEGKNVVVIGISEPCGGGELEAVVKGEVGVGVDCPAAAVGKDRGVCVSKGRTVDGVVSVGGAMDLKRKRAVPVKVQGVKDPWLSVARGLVGGGRGGGKKMSPLLVELGGYTKAAAVEEKGVEEAKASEKDMIDAMEDKLCSPSCLRETMPAPESGVQWTNGKKNLQVELRRRRPPLLGRGKPMMW